MNENQLKQIVYEQFKYYSKLPEQKLINETKLAAEQYINSFKSMVPDGGDPYSFLLNTLTTFVYLDNKVDEKEFKFFSAVFAEKISIDYASFQKDLKNRSKGGIKKITQVITSLTRHSTNSSGVNEFKESLMKLGLAFCSIDGKISDKEMDLLTFYLK
jgi:hypothetical protein